jgi:beta-N-acetylhexosaminidase
MADVSQIVEGLLARMTRDEKIGQCLTLEFCGTMLHRHVVSYIRDLHCAGLRVTPHIYTPEDYGNRFRQGAELGQRLSPYAPPSVYAALLNRAQDVALGSRLHIPLYFVGDQEGDFSQDYCRGGVNLFPSQMGISASGDTDFARRCYRAVAAQQRAVGIRWLHSPVLDVNVNPLNPEINTRAFSDDPGTVAGFGLALLEGFRSAGIIATGKHFPGRGDSVVDVHYATDINRASRELLDQRDLYPYRRLIAAGLPAIMTAHTVYTAIDPDMPASVSRAVVTGLLRNELGFTGVITTDAIGMKGVIGKFSCYGEACAAALAAGNDLVLAKGSPDGAHEAVKWIRRYLDEGLIRMSELEDHVRRVLSLKLSYNIFDEPKVDPAWAETAIHDPETVRLSREAAGRSAILVRDRAGILPLRRDARIFYTDQHNKDWQQKAEDVWYRSHMGPEFLSDHFSDVRSWECRLNITEEDEQRVLAGAQWAEVVVIHALYWRSNPTISGLARRVIATGKPVVLLASSPFRETVAIDEADCLIVTFGSVPRVMENACAILAGRARPGGAWPLKTYSLPLSPPPPLGSP